jgi:GNAT superfamily N-acetyltransferase
MPSYRFCRPDDIPFLVRAINECWVAHFPGTPRMTVDRFRREMKELDLWPSSCMIALTDTDPIAVLTGTKREGETLVSRLGVRPGHEGHEHGSHLLTSLGQKLAVLGPPRLVAEVPAALPRVASFFEREGWRRETAFTDWLRPADAGPVEPVPAGLVAEVTVDDLASAGALELTDDPDREPAWERTRESLLGRKERLRGFAIVGPERIEAWLLVLPAEDDDGDRPAEVIGLGAADPERGPLLLGALLRHAIRQEGGPLRLAKLSEDELPTETLTALGFRPEAEYHRYATEAKPL